MYQRMRHRPSAGIVAIAVVAAMAFPLVASATLVPLDGFTDGAVTIDFDGIDAASNVAASVPGGQRSIWLRGDMQYGTAASATVDTGNRQLVVDGTYSRVTIGYGATAWPGGPGMGGSIQNDPTHAIDQDWSGYTGIRIPFLESTAWLSVSTSVGSAHYTVDRAGNLDIPFGDWIRTDVGMFTISIDNFRAGAFRVGPILLIGPDAETVPEPAELPLFAGGLALLLAAGTLHRRRAR